MSKRTTLPNTSEQAAAEPALTLTLAEFEALTPDERAEARQRAEADKRTAARTAVLDQHDAAEKAAELEITAMATTIPQAAATISARTDAVADAIVALLDDTNAYNELVAGSASVLLSRGLSCSYVDQDGAVEFQTGGAPGERSLMLHGAAWPTVEPLTVVWRAVATALAAKLGAHARPVDELRHARGVVAMEKRSGALFKAV